MGEAYAVVKQLWVVWLMAVFVAIAFWAFRPANRRRFQAHARIPLDDGPAGPPTDPKGR